jgi:hypothetical protein
MAVLVGFEKMFWLILHEKEQGIYLINSLFKRVIFNSLR